MMAPIESPTLTPIGAALVHWHSTSVTIVVFTRADCPSDSPLMCPLVVAVSINVSVELYVGPFSRHTIGLSVRLPDGQTYGQCLGNWAWSRDHVVLTYRDSEVLPQFISAKWRRT
jgi:hypothetical protein